MGMMLLAAIPAAGVHLLIHFGVAGYAFHYVPALLALMAVGFAPAIEDAFQRDNAGAVRGLAVAASLAAVFLFYPTDLEAPGFRGQFDLSFARHTRRGLATPQPMRDPDFWRTTNSQRLPGNTVAVPTAPRKSLMQILPTGQD